MAVAEQPTTQQPTVGRDVAIRRVAIVLSSLPADVTSRLIGGLSGESKQRLSRELRALTDVDPLEKHRAIEAFKGSLIDQQSGASGSGAREHVSQSGDTFSHTARPRQGEVDPIARVYRMDDVRNTTPWQQDTESSSERTKGSISHELSFLADIDDGVLTDLIAGEHPQAIALVLASIAPSQAARIVPTLEPRLQSETLNRISRLDEVSDEAIADLSEHLKSKVDRYAAVPQFRRTTAGGNQTLQAILKEMPSNFEAPTPSRTEADIQRQAVPTELKTERLSSVDEVHSPRIAKETVSESTKEIRRESSEETLRKKTSHTSNTTAASSGATVPNFAVLNPQPFQSTDEIHQHLIKMKPKELCNALAQVETRQALLVLCGLPNSVAESALASLPRSQAKQVRVKLARLGSLQLREIDEAKELVALASIGWKPNDASSDMTAPHTDRSDTAKLYAAA